MVVTEGSALEFSFLFGRDRPRPVARSGSFSPRHTPFFLPHPRLLHSRPRPAATSLPAVPPTSRPRRSALPRPPLTSRKLTNVVLVLALPSPATTTGGQWRATSSCHPQPVPRPSSFSSSPYPRPCPTTGCRWPATSPRHPQPAPPLDHA